MRGKGEATTVRSDLAVRSGLSASTQIQARAALRFLVCSVIEGRTVRHDGDDGLALSMVNVGAGALMEAAEAETSSMSTFQRLRGIPTRPRRAFAPLTRICGAGLAGKGVV